MLNHLQHIFRLYVAPIRHNARAMGEVPCNDTKLKVIDTLSRLPKMGDHVFGAMAYFICLYAPRH